MARDLIKKIVIGGAIILSTALPVLGKDGNPLKQPEKKPIERVVMLSKSAPFVDSKYRLAKKEQDFLIGLEELNYKLEKDGLGKDRVLDYYSKNRVERQGDIINYFTRNPERRAAASKLTYSRYRKLLGLDEKIKSAPDFFEEYQDFLMQASEKYSVPPSIIASIIGVESDFSKNKGKYPAFDALASLYITSKKDFAYRELKELLRFCDTRDRKLDDFISSYAETIGLTPLIHSIYTGLKEFLAFFDTKDQILNELTSSYAGAIGWAPLIHYTYTGLKEFLAFFDTKDQ
ncbi:lytic murein transglycosylase, partial [Candidatus Woesearchaeota archaeon]|nr:lytic murein transglycosylase [Candidatus Woesearchaeota archaeon]